MNHQWHHCTKSYRSLYIKTGCQTVVALCVLSKTVLFTRVCRDELSETRNSSVFLLNWRRLHGERTQSVINRWVCIFHSRCTSLSLYIFNKYINNWVQTICWVLAVLTLVLFLFLIAQTVSLWKSLSSSPAIPPYPNRLTQSSFSTCRLL